MGELTYFDYAATTYPKPEIVYQNMDCVNRTLNFNAGRGSYQSARQAQQLIDETKCELLNIVQGTNIAEVVLAASATIACNQIIGGIAWEKSDVVYVTPFEHNAVMRPLYLQQQKIGFEIKELPLQGEQFELDLKKAAYLFALKAPRAVFASHISNVLGYILPVQKLFEMAKEYESVTVLDASQSMGLIELDLRNMPIDYLVFAGHKNLYGPFGVGGFLKRKECGGCRLNPYFAGGTGTDSLNLSMPAGTAGLEFSSPNIVAIAGLKAALSELEHIEHTNNYYVHEKKMTEHIAASLTSIPQMKLYLPKKEAHIGIIACNAKSFLSADVGRILDEEYGIAVRTGYHCAPLIHKLLRDEVHHGIIRISVGRYTTQEEVQKLTEAIREIVS